VVSENLLSAIRIVSQNAAFVNILKKHREINTYSENDSIKGDH